MAELLRVAVVDSHTGGEPTRVVLGGGPRLAGATMAQRRASFAKSHDAFRSAVVGEPRGSDVLVGALLTDPVEEGSCAGVVFFNNVGFLGMCGHGTIGVVETLRHLGRISAGELRLDTPAGTVAATAHADGTVSFDNVPSFRHRRGVEIAWEGGLAVGDVAYGGNWFFLVPAGGRELTVANAESLTQDAWAIRQALSEGGVTGADGAEIDHIEFFGPPSGSGADSRNFVLCPGKAYDRSPCGTGTSAKVACLFEEGHLAQGEVWRQEGVTGSVFAASVRQTEAGLVPTIRGQAWVTGEAALLLNPEDPLCWGL